MHIDEETAINIIDILNNNDFNNILDLGTGETTKILSHYKKIRNNDTIITTVDNNKEYLESFDLPLVDNKVLCDVEINSDTSYYIELESKIIGVFDFVIVDGPFGWMSKLPRTNILDLLNTDRISNDSYIIIHDSNRNGERLLIDKIKEILDNKNQKYTIDNYNLHSIFKLYSR